MARKHEAVEWLEKGHSPSEIAELMEVTVSTVMGYLYNQVGEGRIRRSDIVFSIDQDTRNVIERVVVHLDTTYWYDIYREIEKMGKPVNRSDLEVYLKLRDARVALGDMYEIIRDIEVTLHNAIRNVLTCEYGSVDWWRQGISENIRAECAAALEKDSTPAEEPYCYTNFIHLKAILDKQWRLFSAILPKRLASDKKQLLSDLTKLNQVRNNVMHPVRGVVPTDKDFAFVRDFRDYLELDKWLEPK
ncbi:MAG: hypothetical protein DRP09_18675 [Candidatus Thorarchaeota archaeon]|nr:MAG: hypothetical protein DRP09_18675 [Candidatus Thorarchaeota archaeon]